MKKTARGKVAVSHGRKETGDFLSYLLWTEKIKFKLIKKGKFYKWRNVLWSSLFSLLVYRNTVCCLWKHRELFVKIRFWYWADYEQLMSSIRTPVKAGRWSERVLLSLVPAEKNNFWGRDRSFSKTWIYRRGKFGMISLCLWIIE